jgi:N-acetylneuraminate synthase
MSALIIAEAGVNHNGSLPLALELVDAAAEAGADVVKFQTFDAHRLVSARAPKAAYQTLNDQHASQLEMLERLQLSESQHDAIVDRCRSRGIRFMSTGFDEHSLRFLVSRFQMPGVKIPSGEIVNARLLLTAARTGQQIFLSTGMCTLGDIERALGAVAYGIHVPNGGAGLEDFERAYADERMRGALTDRVTLLHCTTEYPAPPHSINLRAMDTLREAFGLRVGYSDHSLGIAISIAAIARGATVLEKHFTLDRNLAGPDHAASLLPGELSELVRCSREIEVALGDARKKPSGIEFDNRRVARQSLVAARPIAAGERITEENLTSKRPGDGVSPLAYWNYVGRMAHRDYSIDDPIEP